MKRLLYLILLLSVPLFAAAELDITRIDIIASADNAAATDLAKAVQYALQNANLGIDSRIQKPENYKNSDAKATLVVTIGDGSLAWLHDHKNSFAGAIAFNVSSTFFLTQRKSEQRLTALYRDQPLSRQLRLAKFLLPNLKRASILRNSATFAEVPPADISQITIPKELQRDLQLGITEIDVNNNPDWLKLLSLSLRETDVVIGIDDPNIYNGETIRGILLTTYRQGKSLIGPSRAFVNAGSLASCYTSTDQYLQQLVDMITSAVGEHRLPAAQFPKNFRIAINKQVATSLNIVIPDENTLSAWPQNYPGDCSHGC